ncbi:MAG: MGMT family protein [bacterium]|nr:MGMT family protein [bacterium]
MAVDSLVVCAYEETPLGWVGVALKGEVVQRVVIGRASLQDAVEALGFGDCESSCEAEAAAQLLAQSLVGDPVDLSSLKICDKSFTPFQKSVSKACRRIPFGATATYGELAQIAGRPKAARAVGGVMAANPFPLIVPCHRVVGASGSLTGFSAPNGLELKRQLLDSESVLAGA